VAQPLRLEYPGAVYHLTSRGDGREDVFLDDRDRERLFISGFPCRVMIDGSPRMASSTTEDKVALASRSWISRIGPSNMTIVVISGAESRTQPS
jgi:hypothetical protein